MNRKQVQVIQTITDPAWIKRFVSSHISGSLTFNIKEIGDKVLVFGSNADSIQWFQKHVLVSITVGIRGGIKIKVHAD